MSTYEVRFDVVLSATSATVAVGDVLCPDASGNYWVVATTANLATAAGVGANKRLGIARTAASANYPVQIQFLGDCPASVTGLGAGTGDTIITLSSTGRLQRTASPTALDVTLGKCDSFGNAMLVSAVPSILGVLAISSGGTGLGTTGAANTFLRSNGTVYAWSQVVLTTDVSGLLPTANGGLGANAGASSGIPKLASGVTSFVTAPSGALVGDTDTQTLTNKTLTLPVIASISNSGTVTLPTGARTLVARDTTDILTAKTISAASNTLQRIGIIDTFANRPASGDFDTQRFTPSDGGPEFQWDATLGLWCPMLNNIKGVEPPGTGTLSTALNSGLTQTKTNGTLRGSAAVGSLGVISYRAQVKSIPTPSAFTIECMVRISNTTLFVSTGANTKYMYAGVHAYESGTGKGVSCVAALQPSISGQWGWFGGFKWASTTSFTDDPNDIAWYPAANVFLRIRVAGGTLFFEISGDRKQWDTFRSAATTTFFTTAPDNYGIMCGQNNAATTTADFMHLYLG